MNKLLETLFLHWETSYQSSWEARKLLGEFCNVKDVAERDKREIIYGEAISAETSIAFSAGFYTAVELLTARGGKV